MGLPEHQRAMTRIGCEHAVIPDKMGAWTRCQGSEASQKILWFEQALRGAVSKWTFQFVHNQAVDVNGQPLVRQRSARHITAQPFEFFRSLAPQATAALRENPSWLAVSAPGLGGNDSLVVGTRSRIVGWPPSGPTAMR